MDDCEADQSHAATVRTKRRRFTVEEADRTLPLITRIVGDIVGQYAQLDRLQTRRKAALGRADRAAAEKLLGEASLAVERLNDLIAELGRIGCQLKDFRDGQVDFPARRNSREVMLCWKLGETRLSYWHEVYAGFAGRRPIDEACE